MHKLVYISLIFALFSCEKEVAAPLGHEFDLDVRLIADSMGYYHLRLSDSWQTLHRISGKVSAVSNSYDLTKIYWERSMLGDTVDIASSAEFADGFVVDSKLKIILE